MKEAVESRELFVLDGLDVVVRGTYHKTPSDISGAQSNLKADRIGVLFVSSLFPTRAGNGDSSVYWADSFAAKGYPSFRIDCPGFGDSDGDPPPDLFAYLNHGGHAPILSAKISELIARFQLSGVLIVGLCAGAVSAIWTAAATTDCKGMILMNPYFYVPQAVRPSFREKLSAWSLQTRFGGVLSWCYALLKEVGLFLNKKSLPRNANHLLLRKFKEMASAGLPILILNNKNRNAAGLKSRTGEFDYLAHVLKLAGRRGEIVVRSVEGADHSLSNRVGRTGARQHAEQWLDTFFPQTDSEGTAASTTCRDPGESGCAYRDQVLNCN
jgi:pimeloyl-ACP methyl ester carboxylesterase